MWHVTVVTLALTLAGAAMISTYTNRLRSTRDLEQAWVAVLDSRHLTDLDLRVIANARGSRSDRRKRERRGNSLNWAPLRTEPTAELLSDRDLR